MREIFSTARISPRKRYSLWRDVAYEYFVPNEQRRLDDRAFNGRLEVADIGGLHLKRTTFSPIHTESTPLTVRRHAKHGTLAFTMRLSGTGRISQFDRATIQRVGDLTVLDGNQPFVYEFPDPASSLLVRLPRERLESMLGPARLYVALAVGRERPGAFLARSFFDDLVRVHGTLSAELAGRMAQIGIDLIVAAFAEHMAQETPKPIHGTVIVQRAKAYMEANLGDAELDPPHVAAAMGVSVRYLQQLFHDRGRHVSDWIWERRLARAALWLADPERLHLQVGTVAHSCGFKSLPHFSRRFRARFDISPGDYRRRVHRLAHRLGLGQQREPDSD